MKIEFKVSGYKLSFPFRLKFPIIMFQFKVSSMSFLWYESNIAEDSFIRYLQLIITWL